MLATREATEELFRSYCATEMTLEENILGRSEYEKAIAGKRHWRDERFSPWLQPLPPH